MKLRTILTTGMIGMAMTLFAQTHKEGIEYYKADQFNNAKELLERNYNNPGTDKSLADYYRGQIAIIERKYDEAAKLFNEGIQIDPNNPYNYVGLGMIELKKNKDPKAAQKFFKTAEGKAKKDATVFADIARAYYDVDPVAYEKEITKKIETGRKKDLQNPDIYILEGDMLRDKAIRTADQRMYGSAAAKYDMAIGYDPTSAAGYVKYAKMFSDLNNYAYAITKLQELLRNNPSSALGQRQLADAYYESKQYTQAADAYGKYIQNPNHFKDDENRYAFLLYSDDKFQDGYDYATMLLTNNPNDFSAMRFQLMNASNIEGMADQLFPMAQNLWRKHLEDPTYRGMSVMDYNIVGNQFFNAGNYDDAIKVYQEAIEKQPNYQATFQRLLGRTYSKMEQYENATQEFLNSLNNKETPTSDDYYFVAVNAYYGGKQAKDGNAEKGIAPDAEKAAALFGMAKEYAQKGSDLFPNDNDLRQMVELLNQY